MNTEKYTLEFKWTVSRGRDTYGYNICSLYVDGVKSASCNGGGYDMEGTVLGDWVARKFASRLLALKEENMPEQSHWDDNRKERVIDERSFYGLTFHDPDYNPGKAVNRTFSKTSEGKTVEQAEKDGDKASSRIPTKRHRLPLIDGACGFSSVKQILGEIGCELERIKTGSQKDDIYILHCKACCN